MGDGPAAGQPSERTGGSSGSRAAVPPDLEPLRITIERDDGAAPVVTLSGELDLSCARAVADALDGLVREGADVVIDLAELRFIDSSGLSVLAVARRDAVERGGTVVLRHPSANVVKLLAISGLDQLLPVEP